MGKDSAKFIMNHLGYMPQAKKRVFCVSPEKETFIIQHYNLDTSLSVVFEGRFLPVEGEDGSLFVGDFSTLTEEGDYRIVCGHACSRPFRIQKDVYEPALRMMLLYFKWQRCGSPLGWAGCCHTDDGYIAGSDRHVDLSGGYHQSCDLRKSPCGVSLGVLNMIRAYSLCTKYPWAAIEWKDEIRWAADYYCKTVQACGRVYNTLNEPFGWEGRIFYESEPPSSASFTVVRILCAAADVIGERQADYLATARQAFAYMMSKERYAGIYHHPAPTPVGMDREDFYADIYKNSTADLAHTVCAAIALYRATKEEAYLRVAEEKGDILLTRFVTSSLPLVSAILKVDADNEDMLASSSYIKIAARHEAFTELLSCTGKEDLRTRLSAALDRIAAHYRALCRRSVFGIYPSLLQDRTLDVPTGWADENGYRATLRERTRTKIYSLGDGISYTFGGFFPNRHLQDAVQNLCIATDGAHAENVDIAQNLLNTLLGCNIQDLSYVSGIGFNQPYPAVFGQFFPSTPPIPGGIVVGGNEEFRTDSSYYSEYDMPAVGLAMYTIALLTRATEKL